MDTPTIPPKCGFCGKQEGLVNDLGFWLCPPCRARYQGFECKRCGAQWCGGVGSCPDGFCSDCQMRDLIATFDPDKLELVRQKIHAQSVIMGVKEAREQFGLSISESMDIAVFLQQEEANRPTPYTEN